MANTTEVKVTTPTTPTLTSGNPVGFGHWLRADGSLTWWSDGTVVEHRLSTITNKPQPTSPQGDSVQEPDTKPSPGASDVLDPTPSGSTLRAGTDVTTITVSVASDAAVEECFKGLVAANGGAIEKVIFKDGGLFTGITEFVVSALDAARLRILYSIAATAGV